MYRTKSVTAEDGTEIRYTVSGRGDSTVVLSNGIGCNEVFFKYLVRDLEKRCRVICWHMRAHMDSGIPRDPSQVGFSHLLDDMRRVLQAEGEPGAVLVGLSMGAELNFEYYRRWPDAVQGIVVVNGHYEYPMKSFLDSATLETFFPLLLFASRVAPRTVQRGWRAVVGGPWSFWVAKRWIVNGRKILPEDFFAYLPHIRDISTRCFLEMAYYLGGHSARDLLPQIRVPVLILTGSRDVFTPIRFSQEMASRIPDARLVEIEGGSHAMLIEFPHVVNPLILEFLAALETAAGGGRRIRPVVE